MNTETRILIFAGLLVTAFAAGWVAKGWKTDSKELERTNEAIVVGWQLQSDLNGVLAKLATEKADLLATHNQLDKDVANYVKNPNRNTTRLDADRVRIKSEAARAANSITRPDN